MANKIEFKLEKRADENTGVMVDTLLKITTADGEQPAEEAWCTVTDLDRLFDECVQRWGNCWDLNKLITAIRECDFD